MPDVTPGISAQFSEADLAKLTAMLSPEQVPNAQVSALNKTLAKVRTQVKLVVKQKVNIPARYINDNNVIRTVTANKNTLSGAIRVSRKPIPLIEYGATQTKNGVTLSREIHSRTKLDKKGTKGIAGYAAKRNASGGVNVKVQRDGGVEHHPHFFIAMTRSGHIGVFRRRTPKRHPIDQMYGPAVVGVLAGVPSMLEKLQQFAADDLGKQVASQIQRFTANPNSSPD